MSDLRIRSEAVPEAGWAQNAWAMPFLPPQARVDGFDAMDDSDFAPLLLAAARSLSLVFGHPVEVLPGRPPRAIGNDPVPRIAPVLAALLATIRLGGDITRPVAASPAGVATARHARAIADALDAVAARVWPIGCRLPGFDLDIACGVVAGHAHVPAPERPAEPPPVPVAALAARLFELPMRVRVELASDMALVATLLPLRAGTVLPIDPAPEMPLIVGDHCIGRATLASTADGRQLATIVGIGVEALGGRP